MNVYGGEKNSVNLKTRVGMEVNGLSAECKSQPYSCGLFSFTIFLIIVGFCKK